MSLDHFAIDAAILYFCEIDFVTTFNPANNLIVYILYTMIRGKEVTFLVPRAGESTGYIRVSSGFGQNADGVVYKNDVEFRLRALPSDDSQGVRTLEMDMARGF
jgi:hypothetical protein